MSYISYFDLLGTKGFCDNPKTYYNNIQTFYQTINDESCLLARCGQVGIFSDCAYAESSDLDSLISFLVEVRDRLASQNLFFNAVVKQGTLGIHSANITANKPSYGIVFNDSSIADLYIAQTSFKGIGILVDPSIVDDVNNLKNYQTTDCIYIEKINKNGKTIYSPKAYKDIKINCNGYQSELEQTLNIFYHEFYSAYIKSPKFGRYYISALSNFIRSCDDNLKWDFKNRDFDTSQLTIFKIIEKTLSLCQNELSDLFGIEYLALVLIDKVYTSPQLTDEVKKSYTKKIVSIECVKRKFIHSLNEIPKSIFTYNKEKKISNRDLFISYCQEDLSSEFVDKVLDHITI
jgi:hypothetical protein